MINERIKLLEEDGWESIGGVGKSFGGQLALTSRPILISWFSGLQQKVLDKTRWKDEDLPC